MDAARRLGAAAVVFHAALADGLGLSASDMKILDLIRTDGPLSPRQIRLRFGLAPATLTDALNRLDGRHLIDRRVHPDDGRTVLLSVRDEAVAELTPLFARLGQTVTEVLERFGDDELEMLADAMASLADAQLAAAGAGPDQPPPGVTTPDS